MPEQKFSDSELTSLRESIKDVVVIARRLAPYYDSTEDLIGVLELGAVNDAQLKLLAKEVLTPQQPAAVKR